MRPTRFRTPVAMRICQLAAQRFNEAVSQGQYTCAPPSSPGRPRLFEFDDLIVLYWFARQLELGLAPHVAGEMACAMKKCLPNLRGPQDRPFWVQGTNAGAFMSPEEYKRAKDIPPQPGHFGTLLEGREINVPAIRHFINAGIEHELSILGSSEEI